MIILSALFAQSAVVFAQAERKGVRSASKTSQEELSDKISKTKADVVKASQEYKLSLEKLFAYYESDAARADEQVEKRRKLFDLGVVSKREVEESERALNEAKAKLDLLNKQIEEADAMISEAEAAEELAKSQPLPLSRYSVSPALIRYTGSTRWFVKDIVKVEGFFANSFKRSLPISAYGQTAVHDKLGFDHGNAIDVAVHPESPEGQALMDYLRREGIPFLAFRHAVQGSATGAHIHIGEPSPRLFRSSSY